MAAVAPRERSISPDWRPSSPQARSLARSLRRDRLTVLQSDDRASMTALLTAGVLPLLGRRAADATSQQHDEAMQAVLTFPERRQQADRGAVEILVLFDAGTERSVDLLKSRFEASVRAAGFPPSGVGRCLADHIEALAKQQRTEVLFIIDGFDALVPATGVAGPAQQALIDELVDLLNRPVPANLLIATSMAAWAMATPFTARLREVDTVVVPLVASPPGAGAAAPPARTLEVPPPTVTPAPGRRSAAAEAFLRGNAETGAAGPHAGDPFEWPLSAAFDEPPPALGTDLSPPHARVGKRSAFLGGAALLVLAGLAFWRYAGNDAPAPIAMPAPVAPPRAAPPVLAALPPAAIAAPAPVAPIAQDKPVDPSSLPLPVDGAGHLSRRMLDELARTIREPGNDVVAPTDVPGASARLASVTPALVIASYDDLRQAAAKRTMPLRVMAPLGTEPIDVLVRNDSPLHFLHEIEGRRIAVGPAGESRAVTAGLLYREMFGSPLPAAQALAGTATEAVQRLLHGTGNQDAVLMLGTQAQTVLAALSDSERRSLRPLTLQADGAPSRRAMQDYLPYGWTDAAGAKVKGLASLSFLVATGTDDGAVRRLDRITEKLCSHLGQLQRDGDPGWREVQAGWQPPIALARVDTQVIDTAWAHCKSDGSTSSTPLK